MTELYQLGLVELANPEAGGGEGIYRHVNMVIAMHRFQQKKNAANNQQLNLL